MMNVKEFVLEYIQREYALPEDVDVMGFNYVEEGYIDSLGMLQFIATLEDEFNIAFSDEEMVSDDIQVVGGIIKLIEDKLKA